MTGPFGMSLAPLRDMLTTETEGVVAPVRAVAAARRVIHPRGLDVCWGVPCLSLRTCSVAVLKSICRIAGSSARKPAGRAGRPGG